MDLGPKNAVLRRCGYDDPVEIILVVARVFEEAPHARRVGRDRIEIGARPACDPGVDEGNAHARALHDTVEAVRPLGISVADEDPMPCQKSIDVIGQATPACAMNQASGWVVEPGT